MDGVRISNMPAALSAQDTDQLEVNQGGTSRRVTVDQLAERIASSEWIGDAVSPPGDGGIWNVADFGAVGDGVTDDAAAIQAALDADTAEVVVPPGTYRCASGIVIPEGVTLRGYNFQPDNPPTRYGSVLMFDAAVPTCVTLAGAVLQACSMREMTIARAGALPPPAGSIGVLVSNGYNVCLEHVMSYNHAVGFKWFAAAPGGLGAQCSYLFTGAIGDAHIVYDTWAELYVLNSRFGLSGTNNIACNTYIRVQGGNPGTGAGPNGINFTNCQFNQGNEWPAYFCSFVNCVGTIGGSPNTDATSFKFTSCHIEGYTTAVFHSDSTFNRLQNLWSVNCGYHSNIPFMALDAATQPWSWHFVGNEINGPLTLAPTNPLVAVFFSANAFNGAVTLTGPSGAGSFASFTGNTFSSLALAGEWASLVVEGGSVSTLVNNAKGNLSIALPGAVGGGRVETTYGASGSREIGRSVAYNTTPTNNDGVYRDTYVTNSVGTPVLAMRQSEWLNNVTSGAENALTYWSLMTAGASKDALMLTGSALRPVSNDGLSLGVGGTGWADLYLADGGNINFNNGAYTITQSGASLSFSGGMTLTGALTGTTATFSGDVSTAGLLVADGLATPADQNQYALNVGRYSSGFGKAALNTQGPYGWAIQVNGTAALDIDSSGVSVSGSLLTRSGAAVAAGANTQAFVKASSAANLGLYYGTGNPAFSAAKGSLYTKTDATTTTTRLWVNTDGASTWTNLTTAA